MSVKSKNTRRAWRDPDEIPELTNDWFQSANLYHGKKLIRRGRPPKAAPKVSTTLRLSPEVIKHFRAGGPGWQTRIDDALKRLVARKSAAAPRSQR
jgi:uncharacterized protein (DUF4415 family)